MHATYRCWSCFRGNDDVEQDVCDPYGVAKYVEQKDKIDQEISKSHNKGMAVKQDIDACLEEWEKKRAKYVEEIGVITKNLEEVQVYLTLQIF